MSRGRGKWQRRRAPGGATMSEKPAALVEAEKKTAARFEHREE
jgi:hypothetical protein